MDNNKICFISCVNDPVQYDKALEYMKSIKVPAGFQTEFKYILQARSMASGYNQVIRMTDAKYKIYVHQDVYIVDPYILQDIIELFTANPRLGMLGVVGAKTIPDNGMWYSSADRYGRVYDSHQGRIGLLEFHEVKGDYEFVSAIDGLFMATQWDLPWREDLFQGWHFYDVSQSLEYIKAGYEVGVLNRGPRCVHDCGILNFNGYHDNRHIFLHHYHPWINRNNEPKAAQPEG